MGGGASRPFDLFIAAFKILEEQQNPTRELIITRVGKRQRRGFNETNETRGDFFSISRTRTLLIPVGRYPHAALTRASSLQVLRFWSTSAR